MAENTSKTIEAQHVVKLQKVLQMEAEGWGKKPAPNVFTHQCHYLKSLAQIHLAEALDTHQELSLATFEKLLDHAATHACQQLTDPDASEEALKTMRVAALLKTMHWNGMPTKFEQFLEQKGLWKEGNLDIEQYFAKHDTLQTAYLQQHPSETIASELAEYDKEVKIQFLEAGFVTSALVAFDRLHELQTQRAFPDSQIRRKTSKLAGTVNNIDLRDFSRLSPN